MTHRDQRDENGRSDRPPSNLNDGKVGYGRPPVGTRFKTGESGNPRGRPKGSRNKVASPEKDDLHEFILAEARRDIKVNDGGEVVTMPMAQAVVRTLAVNAAKGQIRAQKLFLEHIRLAEQHQRSQYESYLLAAIEYKFAKEIEVARLRDSQLDESNIIPHPDDIVINMQTGEVELIGPMTREEQVAWRGARTLVNKLEDAIRRDMARFMDTTLEQDHAAIRASVFENLEQIAKLTDVIGEWDR